MQQKSPGDQRVSSVDDMFGSTRFTHSHGQAGGLDDAPPELWGRLFRLPLVSSLSLEPGVR